MKTILFIILISLPTNIISTTLKNLNNNDASLQQRQITLTAIIDNTQQQINLETNEQQKNELSLLLNHLKEHEKNFYENNIITRCPLENCPLHASNIYNLFANCITANNSIINNALINGTLCISGAIECSECGLPAGATGVTGATGATGPTGATGATGSNGAFSNSYFFAFDTTSQSPTTIFTDITFSNNGANDGNWTHTAGFADFTAINSGTYLITIMLFYGVNQTAPTVRGTISSHITKNGSEIPGSQSVIRAQSSTIVSSNDVVNNVMGRSIITSITAGDVIRVQHIQDSAVKTLAFLAPRGTGTTPTSISISIVRIIT